MAWVAAHFAGDAALASSIGREFPPDVPFGLGTSAPRLIAALGAHGLATSWIHSGAFGVSTTRAKERLGAHLLDGAPAIVCVDAGRLGGPAFGAHWAVATGVEGDTLRLENYLQPGPVTWREFMASWRCPHLPLGYNHCALLVRARTHRAARPTT